MDVFEAIKSRRSIRHYKAEPVDDKTLEAVLEAAHWAPSWGNMQCWRFITVRDPAVKSQVADTLMKTIIDNEPVENASARAIKQAPVLVVLCAETNQAGCGPDGTPTTDKGEHWYMFDTALAMENLVLAAYALGLGTVIVGNFDADRAGKILEVPPGCCVVTMTPLGFPERKGQVSPRKRLSDVVYQEKFRK
jgi:nitroreductase